MRKFLLIGLTMVFLIGVGPNAWGQYPTEYLNRVIDASDLVIEGEVISKTVERDEHSGAIYTLNHIRIDETFLGVAPTQVAIRTEGGTIDDMTTTVFHTIQLKLKEHCLFALTEVENRNGVYMFTSNGNKITKDPLGIEEEGFIHGVNEEIKSWRFFREHIGDLTGHNVDLPPMDFKVINDHVDGVCFKLDRFEIYGDVVQFELLIKGAAPGFIFSEANISFDYPKEVFGSNVVSNEQVFVTKGETVQAPFYETQMKDINDNTMGLTIGNDCQSATLSYVLSTKYESFAYVRIKVKNLAAAASADTESITANGDAKYFTDYTECKSFNDVCFESSVLTACTVTSVVSENVGAGVQHTVTINGSMFGGDGATNPNGLLRIPNANTGGANRLYLYGDDALHIQSWADDQIVVRVSSDVDGGDVMGSGRWYIRSDYVNRPDERCEAFVNIGYAIDSGVDGGIEKQTGFGIFPGVSGMDIQWWLDDDIDDIEGITEADVIEVARAAFCDWEAKVGIDFRYMGTTPVDPAAPPGDKNVIFFGDPAGESTLAANTLSTFNTCTGAPFIHKRMAGFYINFDIDRPWSVSTSTADPTDDKYDFYSVLLHEIGHAIGMRHSMDMDNENSWEDSRIMYYSLPKEEVKRNIDYRTVEGVELNKERSLAAMAGGCLDGYKLDTDTEGCETSTHDHIHSTCDAVLTSLTELGTPITMISNGSAFGNIELYDAVGHLVYRSQETRLHSVSIPTSRMAAGVYFLKYNCDGHTQTNKLTLH